MNTKLLFENFDLIAQSPGGVQRLRELVINLAIRGKLTTQDSSEEPATDLLRKAKLEKMKLAKEGKIKLAIESEQTRDEANPFELPAGWAWTCLDELGLVNPRNTGVKDSADVSFVPMKMISENYWEPIQFEVRKWADVKKAFTHFSENDVVLAKITPCFENGKSGVAENLKNGIAAGTTELHVFRPVGQTVLPYYVWLFLRSPYFVVEGASKMTGSAGQKRVPGSYFATKRFPLPPLLEQRRIVNAVKEMFKSCQEIETSGEEQREFGISFHRSSTNALNQAQTAPDFKKAWQRLADNFDWLYQDEENLKELRQTILQLAVRGKLVPQDPKDESASVLLERIRAEKAKLVKEGKIREPKELPAIQDEEKPFELPRGWEWVKLADICDKITDGTHHSPANGSKGDYLYISAKNIKEDGVQLSNATWISKMIHDEIYARCDPKKGDILYIKDGATTGVVTVNNLVEPFSMLSSVALIRPNSKVCTEFLLKIMRSPFYYDQMREKMAGAAITRVTIKKLQNAILPLPPFNEQLRIVEALPRLEDGLEQIGLQNEKCVDRIENLGRVLVSLGR